MTFIRDLIHIPEQVHDGDFVLKLTQGVGVSQRQTVDDYVVTTQLAQAFDEALGLVASAVTDGQSKAAYLQGSFGSGKSHFMAMLHLLLSQDTHARSKPELHQAIAKWGPVLDSSKFLLVPIHFLDARSMEHKILGGCVERVEQLHPGAALPGVFLGNEIVATELPNMRARIGDEALIEGLNDASGAGDEWGVFASEWTIDSLERSLAAPATDAERQDLVAAYVTAFRPATVLEASSTGEGLLDIDRGLAAISAHAQSLGYRAVVLLLDELILWLASRIGDLAFVQAESQKLTKLVEATDARRPVPIVSLIARQRDLRELVGDHIAGAEQRSFADNLELQQGRFGRIELASGNLPEVAKRRLLKPVDDEARVQLNSAVEQALSGRDDVKHLLLGSDADIQLFRTVYPFSPALVQALIDVSEALQRERTALKVMLQLLVDQRDTLELGTIVPVGDLWDVVSARDEPFSSELKKLFETAKRLWRTKLHPALQRTHGVGDDTPADAPERRAMANDERIIKTMLLAALVPEVEAFRDMDAARLVALNWGSVTSPIPGRETQMVADKLRRLAGDVSELLVGDDPSNPTVSVRLADVDVDEIVNRAAVTYDNQQARRSKLRAVIDELTEHNIGGDLRGTYEHEWRGTMRPVDVMFANVRDVDELTDSALAASEDRPKLVIDFPFDESGRSSHDDMERLDAWIDSHEPTSTVCWLPSFLNAAGLACLKRYVAVDELMKYERLDDYTAHLSASQRNEARPLLKNLHVQLKARVKDAILCAYGVVAENRDLVDPADALTDHHRSLDPSMVIRPTTAPRLDGALSQICDQVFQSRYPGHPHFDSKVTSANLRTTWDEIQRALADPDERINVEKNRRPTLRNVANNLRLGTMHESHFVLDHFWRDKLDQPINASGQSVEVGTVRTWIDEVPGGPRGLRPEVADLIVLTVAAQTDHRLSLHGAPYEADLGKAVPGDVVLVPERLPSPEEWASAVDSAARIFGETFHKRVTGPELESLHTKLHSLALSLAPAAADLEEALLKAYGFWGLETGERLSTAAAARNLVERLQHADAPSTVEMLARFEAPTSDDAVARSLASAGAVANAVSSANLRLWRAADQSVGDRAIEALQADEVAVGFLQAASQIDLAATAHFVSTGHVGSDDGAGKTTEPDTGEHPTPFDTGPGSDANRRTLRTHADIESLSEQLRTALSLGHALEVTWHPRADS